MEGLSLLSFHVIGLFSASVGLLLLGHFVRALRMTTFYPAGSTVGRFDLLLSLALGYCVNTFVPARLGELVRVMFLGKRCHIRYAYVAATVVCERLSDAAVLGLACLGMIAASLLPSFMMKTGLIAVLLVSVGVALTLAVQKSRFFRRLIYRTSSVFNHKLSFGVLDFAWSTSEIISSRQLIRPKYLGFTALMWAFYSLSYLTFGLAAKVSLPEVMYDMLGSPLHSMLDRAVQGKLAGSELLFLAFGVLPVFAILIVGLFRDKNNLVRVCSSLFRGHFNTWDAGTSPVSEHFREHSQYDIFLASMFGEDDQLLSGFGLNAIEDGVVHRLFNGGSGAITALVEANDALIIRKFAIGDLKDKLSDQVDWLRANGARLPLVEIAAERRDASFYRYDMPYSPTASDFYDVIHTAPIEQSQALLGSVIDTLTAYHATTEGSPASQEEIDRYGADKVSKNAGLVLKFIGDFLSGSTCRINGKDYDLRDWEKLQDPMWIRRQLQCRRTCQIHGDLTIENIIVDPSRSQGWFLIDPNPGNLFDSPLIDWAKLRQSLHLGYEGLNRSASCAWKGSELTIALTRSHAYDLLHEEVEQILQKTLGADICREIQFHELVNYLRLTPYKIRQSPEKGLAFFACTTILIGEYMEVCR